MAPEVIIALSMNGAPLPPEHGFPARTIVPGFIGARSVKWLTAIRVQEHESENYFQKKAYKVFPPDVRPENVNWDQAPALLEVPVNAVIGSVEPAGSASLLVRGYALSGVGPIVKVEVSSDGGSNWKDAVIEPGEGAWSWRLWEARVPAGRSGLDIVARATDSTGATQPANVAPLWNFKGYMNNAWHRVRA
jgi:sulfite oxidase